MADGPVDYVGQVFEDRYRILRLVGEGGMGSAYEAEHVIVGRRVAVKLLHPEMARDPQVMTRFYNEAPDRSRRPDRGKQPVRQMTANRIPHVPLCADRRDPKTTCHFEDPFLFCHVIVGRLRGAMWQGVRMMGAS